MDLKGLRVVRGPDWKWDDQDGGEGHVGTIVSVKIDPQIVNTAIVLWDSGIRANYRIEGSHDLRIFDNATVGVVHESVTCDACREHPLRGIRWKCAECYDYDLCTTCYMTDKHDLTHSFKRYTNRNSSVVPVPKRHGSAKVTAWGVFTGAKVVRGPDWKWGEQDGGSGKLGTVTEIKGWNEETARNAARILWESGTRNLYRLGFQGNVDLKYKEEASGGLYYKDHLPDVDFSGRDGSSGDEIGEALGTAFAKLLSNLIVSDGDESKSSPFAVGDAVRVINETEKVKLLQIGHGEWIDSMKDCLGKIGIVKQVYRSGDLRVYVNDNTWTFNPRCVTLVASNNSNNESSNNSESSGSSSSGVNDELVECAERGRLERVKELVAKHPDWINMRSSQKNGRTALQAACYYGHMEIIRTLLNAKASIATPDDDGDTALHYAVLGNESKVVELLLKANPDIKDLTNHSGRTALHSAAVKQHLECVNMLIKYRCNINKQDSYGDTALHDAITIGADDVIEALVNAPQVDLTLRNKKGFNALHHAALKGSECATKRIVEKKKELVNVKKNDGYTALHVAAVNNHVECARILINEGKCEIDPRNVMNKTPLALAIEEGHKPMIKLLVDNGADMSCVVGGSAGGGIPTLLTLLERLAKS